MNTRFDTPLRNAGVEEQLITSEKMLRQAVRLLQSEIKPLGGFVAGEIYDEN